MIWKCYEKACEEVLEGLAEDQNIMLKKHIYLQWLCQRNFMINMKNG